MKRRNIKAPVSALALIDSENQESSSPPTVINLVNSITLTEGHFGIFKKGPKFVPTPRKADFAEFQEDIRIWKNRLRWAVYHDLKKSEPDNISHDDETSPMELALIKSNKSKFSAPLSKNLALELFLQKVDIEIKNHKEKKNLGDNLSTDERKALQDIRSWSDVIIRPYDKGVGFVIDEVENYKTHIFKELNKSTIYSLVTDIDNAIPNINNRIRDWMVHYHDEISSKFQNWMIDDKAGFGYFYLNYKAHKPEKGYPGRLITSGCGSPTERLSSWCEYHLKPLMTLLPYRLEDTSHFIRKVLIYNEKASTENTPKNIILFSWDIEAMYPNITNDLGLTACKELLNKRDILEPSTDCIIDAIQITLEENIAKFGSTVVKQCDGTAMGPHHACSYADAAADYAVDQKIMSHSLNPLYDKIVDWSRFRDDIFLYLDRHRGRAPRF